MADKTHIAPAAEGEEKRLEYALDEKVKGDTSSSEEIETAGGLYTVENGAIAHEQVALDYTEAEKTRILRKIDYRLVPLLGVLYLLAFIDRGNSEYIPPDASLPPNTTYQTRQS